MLDAVHPDQRAGPDRRRADHRPRLRRRAEFRGDDRSAGAVRFLRRRRAGSGVPVVRRGRPRKATSTSAASATGSSASAGSSTSARTRGASSSAARSPPAISTSAGSDGKTVIRKEGRHRKFVPKLEQICYSASIGRERGQVALFVTERAVFRIGADGLELIEIAPGLDPERDVIAHMGFRPRVARELKHDGCAHLRARPDGPGGATSMPSRAAIDRSASRSGTRRAEWRADDRRVQDHRRHAAVCDRRAIRSRKCARRRSSPSDSPRRASNAVLVPAHVPADRFDEVVPALMATRQSRWVAGNRAVQGAHAALRAAARRDGQIASALSMRCGAKRTVRGPATCSTARGSCAASSERVSALAGRRVVLFGAGGAGSAIACALADAGVDSIAIIDPIQAGPSALARSCARRFPACDVAAVDVDAGRRRHGRQCVAGRHATPATECRATSARSARTRWSATSWCRTLPRR